MAEDNAYNVGDVVQFEPGGPEMIVESVMAEELSGKHHPLRLVCVRFKDGTVTKAIRPAATVESVVW